MVVILGSFIIIKIQFNSLEKKPTIRVQYLDEVARVELLERHVEVHEHVAAFGDLAVASVLLLPEEHVASEEHRERIEAVLFSLLLQAFFSVAVISFAFFIIRQCLKGTEARRKIEKRNKLLIEV